MKIKLTIIPGIILFSVFSVYAQGGGKAEPNRIKFTKGKTGAVLSGTLKNDEQMEYIFGAKKGQKVAAKIVSINPKGIIYHFLIQGADGLDYTSESDGKNELNFTAPQTGDYLLYVQLNRNGKARSGRYALTLSIK